MESDALYLQEQASVHDISYGAYSAWSVSIFNLKVTYSVLVHQFAQKGWRINYKKGLQR